MLSEHIIYAYDFDSQGKATPLEPLQDVDLLSPDGGYHWLHMCAIHAETRDYLENNSDLEPIVIDAMLAAETRPRALIKETGALIILRAMNLHDAQCPEDMISIRIWIDDKKIITTRRRDIKAIEDIVQFIGEGKAPLTPCDLLIMITDRLFARMEPFFGDLEDRISRTEERLASDNVDEVLEDAAIIRKRMAIFMRYVTPQKAVLESLLSADLTWIKDEHREHLVESLDRVTRYVEELQELRDRSQIINDELNNFHGRRLNEITYIFSVAATIFLPLSFLTGLMGINLGGMPGIDEDLAFWVFSGVCGLIVTVQVLLFRKVGWF
jgi:zinc transporter